MAESATSPSPTSVELRARLEARERSIQNHLAALETEVTTVADVTVQGQPLPDVIRSRPLQSAGLFLVGGLTMGLLWGLRRRRRRPRTSDHDEVLRLYAASMLETAAQRVARGEDPEAAIEKTFRRRPPLVYAPPPERQRRGALAAGWEVAFTTAVGFGIKTALDRLAERLTGEEELFHAVEEAREEPVRARSVT
ncbi:MAG: hypothetical protein R3181_08625 [Rubricoccaceae bacterium]|nr:hypothetical protein [Rubricoccaceae bacterium]